MSIRIETEEVIRNCGVYVVDIGKNKREAREMAATYSSTELPLQYHGRG